ncbi:MAG TPA: TonB-dependent receptor [Steroidobacteraceae bacterium]|nr:TonB-dependent receptor [Steroidobacteraceae bacterium]
MKSSSLVRRFLTIAFGTLPGAVLAGGVTGTDIDEVVVVAARIALSGTPRVASEGTVLAEQLQNRPRLRVGELLEVVPGLIVTQHTGDGKANQYFLRGFNLDHGTDFATRVDGMPVNMPSHGHGQGYMDINFVIPELVDRIVYRKGTYYPELGNFSAAGAADMSYATSQTPFVSISGGADAYVRAVAGGSTDFAGGSLLLGFEHDRADGPWQLAQDLRKYNGLARWSRASDAAGLSVSLMAYRGDWTATDQIPQRAVDSGLLDRFGFVDPSNGGNTRRYSLSMQGFRTAGAARLDYSAYVMDYQLQLFSNFTYALNPGEGDQFEQFDERRVYGGALSWDLPFSLGSAASHWHIGVDTRHDDIAPLGLHLTKSRQRYATIREDDVRQTLTALWTSLSTQWTPWLRSEIGARADRFEYDVASNLATNSGSGNDTIVSPKVSMALGPWRDTELFIATGRGFHSNDARGATIAVDPLDGVTPVERVSPLAKATGSEVGVRTAVLPRTQLSASLWQLDLESELLFVGDGGTTEATRPSRRQGVELSLYSKPRDWMIIDADYAWSKPRFRDSDPAGDRIPGAVSAAASLGIALDLPSGWFGGVRLRYLGPAALIEDDSVRSPSSTLVNVSAGRRFGERWKLSAGIYNLLDRRANDIAYFYESQLPGESAPVADIHFHPVEPRQVRATAHVNF